jgi:flagellar biosynthesis/type III secretory pathway protein FliH
MSVAPVVTRIRFHAPLRRVRWLGAPPAAAAPAARVEAPVPPPAPPPPPRRSTEAPETPATPAATPEVTEQLAADRRYIESALQQIQTALRQLREEQNSRIEQWQRAAIELATTMATRVLHERITANDFPIEAKIRDMIAQLTDDVPVVVRLNPADWELLQSRLQHQGDDSLLRGPDAPRFVADATLDRGECHVEGRESMLLSDITRELQDIRDELLRSLK